jgi:hypothetical protein
MEMGVWWWEIISREVMNSTASSDLAAEAMTNFMIWAIDRMALLNQGNGSSSNRYVSTCSAARVGFDEEACIHMAKNIMPLAQ